MKKIMLIILFVVILTSCSTNNNTINDGQINIFNQEDPGMIPVIFAPGFISTDATSEFAGTFSPDYKYYFFTRRNSYNINRLYYSEYINGEWITPVMSPISENVAEFEPFITPDGKMLYFGSMRDSNISLVIFQSEYINDTWQDPEYVNNGLNDGFAMYISVSNSGNIYYTSTLGISVMIKDGDNYTSEFTGISGAHSYIAPDESYMLLDDSGSGEDHTSIYISLNNDGVWGTPIKLGVEVNNPNLSQICSSVSADGKYLFFSRFDNSMADIYWVDADYLDQYIND